MCGRVWVLEGGMCEVVCVLVCVREGMCVSVCVGCVGCVCVCVR